MFKIEILQADGKTWYDYTHRVPAHVPALQHPRLVKQWMQDNRRTSLDKMRVTKVD